MLKEAKHRWHEMFENAVKRGGRRNLSELAREINFHPSLIYRMAWGEKLASIDKVLPLIIRGKKGCQPGFESQEEVFQLLTMIEPVVNTAKMEKLRENVEDELKKLKLPAKSTNILFIIKELHRNQDEQERNLQATRQMLKQLEELL